MSPYFFELKGCICKNNNIREEDAPKLTFIAS